MDRFSIKWKSKMYAISGRSAPPAERTNVSQFPATRGGVAGNGASANNGVGLKWFAAAVS
jgi:hypothetical protein